MRLRARDALLVIDVQNDFVSGSMAIAGADRIIAPINALVAFAPHVIVAMDWHPPGHISFASSHAGHSHGDHIEVSYGQQRLFRDHCVQGTWGAALDDRLDVVRAELVIRKGYKTDLDSFSAFHWNDGETRTGLAGYLRDRGIDRVYVAGLARLGCVLHSAFGAAREGFEVLLIDDASVGDARRSEEECMALLRNAGGQLVVSRDLLE